VTGSGTRLRVVVLPALALALPGSLGAQAGDPPPPPDTVFTVPAAERSGDGGNAAPGGWWHTLGSVVALVDRERFVFVGARWTRFAPDAVGFDVSAGLAPRFAASGMAVLGLDLDFVAPGSGRGVLVRPVWGVTGLALVGDGALVVPGFNAGLVVATPAAAGARIRFDLRTRFWGVGEEGLTTWSLGVGVMWR
jgi:hypothetical protein